MQEINGKNGGQNLSLVKWGNGEWKKEAGSGAGRSQCYSVIAGLGALEQKKRMSCQSQEAWEQDFEKSAGNGIVKGKAMVKEVSGPSDAVIEVWESRSLLSWPAYHLSLQMTRERVS